MKLNNYKNAFFLFLGTIIILCTFFFIRLFYKNEFFTVMKAPEFELIDQNNTHFSSKRLKGKVYVVEFFYSTCPTICPIMNSNFQIIKDRFKSSDLALVSITIDPKNDTPRVLKQHEKNLGITGNQWHFLTGDGAYIQKIADQFNIYVGDKVQENKHLEHSGMIALVDKDGYVKCRLGTDGLPILYYSGLNYANPDGKEMSVIGKFHPELEWLIEDIKKLLD